MGDVAMASVYQTQARGRVGALDRSVHSAHRCDEELWSTRAEVGPRERGPSEQFSGIAR